MNKLKSYYRQFHPIVWVLLSGTVLARGSAFATLPFLAIYLSRNLDLHPVLIGITIGISPLSGVIGGFLGGHLSDRFGRKPVMIGSLFSMSLVYFGFMVAETPGWFIVLNALNGLSGSFFEPTGQALIADLTEKSKRMRAFSLRYTAINIGASVGPLLGAYLAVVSAKSAFMVTGIMYFIYLLILALMMKKYNLGNPASENASKVTIANSLKIIGKDKALRYLILGTIIINFGYSQMESNVPQYLESTIANGVFVYSVMLSINAVMVVLLQMPISHYAERFKTMQVMMAGAVFLSVGMLSFGFVTGWYTGILAIVFITIGEILIFPSSSYLVDQLATDELRGTYFGAAQFRRIGHFLGPIAGGYILSEAGGTVLFSFIALVVLGSILFFIQGNKIFIKTTPEVVKN
ncbi:MDR family MFS transporter [Mesobacillus selenatarsenatis]|uniref:Multidrug resistance protein B n=1 Tax=Mesobacillus selenatarsenatis (strain DSM 18680 / JCM 14380 / FERM P-15431 / SF-1) TaxID=1321606 RepID=A0A0A8X861_MESS1|nr:MFS transporter [Mesobacillus selenatarsenatis]GAM16118.1 multidrug resistance protein B [Mesobacillus selenatarsenatis SF-1]